MGTVRSIGVNALPSWLRFPPPTRGGIFFYKEISVEPNPRFPALLCQVTSFWISRTTEKIKQNQEINWHWPFREGWRPVKLRDANPHRMTQHQKQQKKKEGTKKKKKALAILWGLASRQPTFTMRRRKREKKKKSLPRRCEGPESKRSHCIRVRGSQHFELQWRRPFFFFFFYPAPPRAPFF